jgi:hypothetical protein
MATRNSFRVIGEIAVQYGLPSGDPCWIAPMIGNFLLIPGNFCFVKDSRQRELLTDGWKAVENLHAWEYLRDQDTISLPGGYVYLSNHPLYPTKEKDILQQMEVCHSERSFKDTMLHMKSIAEFGWDSYYTTQLKMD